MNEVDAAALDRLENQRQALVRYIWRGPLAIFLTSWAIILLVVLLMR